jgi:hypothetical protein
VAGQPGEFGLNLNHAVTLATPSTLAQRGDTVTGMSGAVIHSPKRKHVCRPGCTYRVTTDEDSQFLPVGVSVVIPPDPWRYPRGTVWKCDCGQTYVSKGSPAEHMPGVCKFRREGRFKRWCRERH